MIDRRIRLLLFIHVVLGLLMCGLAASRPLPLAGVYPLIVTSQLGLTFAQSCLLAFWVVYDTGASLRKRWFMISGIAYFELLILAGNYSIIVDKHYYQNLFAFIAAAETIVTAGIALLARALDVELISIEIAPDRARDDALRVSIRALMISTLVTAVLISAAKELRDSLDLIPVRVLFGVIFVPGLVATGLMAFWAALGFRCPALRSLFILLLSTVLGGMLAYGVKSVVWSGYVNVITIVLVHAMTLLASLLYLRWCGYRLVKAPGTLELVVRAKRAAMSRRGTGDA